MMVVVGGQPVMRTLLRIFGRDRFDKQIVDIVQIMLINDTMM